MNELMPIIEQIVSLVVGQIVSQENFAKYGDRLFDLIEDTVADSNTKIDDALVLPVVKAMRLALNVPDLPDVADVAEQS
ncbi:MAG: hypothetical protein WC117_01075 [Sphaerochaetaceae bacterium]